MHAYIRFDWPVYLISKRHKQKAIEMQAQQ